MARAKIYATEAERQAAHRERRDTAAHERTERLYRLQRAIWAAADRGDALAGQVQAASLDTIVERLAEHFEGLNASPLPLMGNEARTPSETP